MLGVEGAKAIAAVLKDSQLSTLDGTTQQAVRDAVAGRDVRPVSYTHLTLPTTPYV